MNINQEVRVCVYQGQFLPSQSRYMRFLLLRLLCWVSFVTDSMTPATSYRGHIVGVTGFEPAAP